jgi:predicted helicase
MKLSKDATSVQVNESLTLADIPPEAFKYRLGSKSAIEWVIDQYQVRGDSGPNREDDPGYIVRLLGQVVRVSVETVQIVSKLPDFMPLETHSVRSA